MTLSFAASRSVLSIRLGRFEDFAQRETAPAANHGITREGNEQASLTSLPLYLLDFVMCRCVHNVR